MPILERYPIPTDVPSSIDKLPSLDEMLGDGLEGNWILAGVTGVGKTTLSMSYLGNYVGPNRKMGAGILNYGMRQGHERYVEPYGKEITDFHELINSDAPNQIQSIRQLSVENQSDERDVPPAYRKWFNSLEFLRRISINGVPLKYIMRDLHPEILEASLNKKSKPDIVKMSLIQFDENPNLMVYFGRNPYEALNKKDTLGYRDMALSAFLYHTFRVNKMRRFLIDGVSLQGDVRPVQHDVFVTMNEYTNPEGRSRERKTNVATLKAPQFLLYTEDVYPLYSCFSGRTELAVPFIGTNPDKFVDNRGGRNFWHVDEPVTTLTSLTLTGRNHEENVADIDYAVNITQTLLLCQEADGAIALGRNSERHYAFERGSKTEPAPPNTRILAIAKSRFGADETYREITLDQKTLRPVLGRRMIYRE